MKKITFKGTDITLECNQLSVGDTLKSCILVGNDLNEVELTKTNGIRVILSVPSIDTPVCDTEVRRFNKEIESLPNAHMPPRSADTNLRNSRKPAAKKAGYRRHITRNPMISRAGSADFWIRNPKISPFSGLFPTKNF